MALLTDFFQSLENTIWDNKVLLPWCAMSVTALLFAITQTPLLLSVGGVALSGVLTLGGVKFGDLYAIAKKMLTDAQTKTLPALDQTLEDVNELLPKLKDVVDELEHPVQHVENEIVEAGEKVKGKASELLSGFMHVLDKVRHPDAANDAPEPSSSTPVATKKKASK